MCRQVDSCGVNKFFRHYFLNRKQYVNIGDFNSSCKDIQVGLTQGGILSPLLFNLFINDLSYFSQSHDFNVTLFADDAVFYISGPNFNDLINKLNIFISHLTIWLQTNLLCPNVNKTKLMLFSQRNNILLPDVYFNNTILEWVNSFKYLGIFIDRKLTFAHHTMFLSRKISSVLGMLRSTRQFLNTKALKTLYYALVYSIVTQSIIVYGNTYETNINPIRILLNKILRTILNVKCDANRVPLLSTTSMYFNLRLLKFNDARNYFLLKFLRTALYFNPVLYHKYFSVYVPDHDYNNRNFRLRIPPARTEIFRRSPVFKSILLFNSLPEYLTLPMSHFKFKKLYKQYILNQYFNEL